VAGDAVPLDVDAAALKLADQSEQELVPAAVGRDVELMEDGDVGPVVAGRAKVAFGPDAPRQPPQERSCAHADDSMAHKPLV
jgi:hypothetical protein